MAATYQTYHALQDAKIWQHKRPLCDNGRIPCYDPPTLWQEQSFWLAYERIPPGRVFSPPCRTRFCGVSPHMYTDMRHNISL